MYWSTVVTAGDQPRRVPSHHRPSSAMPIAMLVTGPMPAMANSSPGVSASDRVCAMPPKMNSVMPSTGMPFARATSECDSSWTSSDPKKSSAPATPMMR